MFCQGRRDSLRRTNRARRVSGLVAVFVVVGLGSPRLAGGDPAHLPGAGGTLWVTNRTGTVMVFDAGTGARLDTVTVGSKPTAAVAPHGTGKVYVSNGSPSDSVSVISKETRTVVATISTGPGTDPHHMADTADGRAVFVALFGTGTVAVVDTATDKLVDRLAASGNPAAKTHAVWASNDGATLYATNSLGSAASSPAGTVSAVDVASGARLWEVAVGRNPSEVLVTENGRTAYVTVRTENAVKVLDLTAEPEPVVTHTVPVGNQPDTVQLTNDNKILVVALRGTPAATLMDTRTLQTRTVAVTGTTTGHHWLSANGRYTFLAVVGTSGQSGVAVIENRSATVARSYLLPGVADPHGVFFEPSQTRASTASG